MTLPGFVIALRLLFNAPHQRAMREKWAGLNDEYKADAHLRWFAAELAKLKPEDDKRTTDQNAKLWAMLQDLADQVDWYGEQLSKEDWKDMMTAAMKRERVVPGIKGGFVVLGQRTSKMSKPEFSELVETLYEFGARQGVKWSDPVERKAA